MKPKKMSCINDANRNRRGMPVGTVEAQKPRSLGTKDIAYAYGERDVRGFLMGYACSKTMAIACAEHEIVKVRIEVVE